MSTTLAPTPAIALTPAAPPAPAAATAPCANCGTPLVSHYCHECGAPRLDERPLTVRRFVRELVHEVTNHDSRLLSTLRLLFTRPGQLTAEYLAGHTRRHLSPVRVFVLSWAAFIFLSHLMGTDEYMSRQMEKQLGTKQDTAYVRLMDKASRQQRSSTGAMQAEIAAKTYQYQSNEWLRLVDPLAAAGVLALLYRGRRRNFAEHTVFALHLLSFNAVLALLSAGLHVALENHPARVLVVPIHWVLLAPYFFLAARAVHDETRARTGAKTLGFLVGSQAAMAIVPFFAAIVATIQVMLF